MPITHLITILLHYLRIDFLTIPLAFLPPPPFLPPSPTPFHRSRFRIRTRWWVAIVHGHLDTRVVLVISLNIYIYIYTRTRSNQPLSRYRRFGAEVPRRRRSRRSSVKRRGGGGRERKEARTPAVYRNGLRRLDPSASSPASPPSPPLNPPSLRAREGAITSHRATFFFP